MLRDMAVTTTRRPAAVRAPVGRRLTAAAVDLTVVPLAVVTVAEAAWRTGILGLLGVSADGWRTWSWSFPAVAWTVAAAALAYHAAFVARWGATPGKRLCGLRVEARDGGPVGAARALGRGTCAAALYLPWFAAPLLAVAGALSVAAGSRRSPADRAAGTRVVRSAPMRPAGRAGGRASGAPPRSSSR
jgi:uncharacterized RDD family membrane protein YckC